MVKLSKRDLQIIAGVIGAADFFYEGALTKPVSRAVKKAIGAGAARLFLNPGQVPSNVAFARGVAGAAVRPLGTAAAVGRTIAMRHPYVAAGAVIYVAVKNREQIADLLKDGYDIVSDLPIPEMPRGPPGFDPRVRPLFRKKKPTPFNSAVKKGMSIVKASTSYGKKGTINNAKKAFAAVTKVASAASKKKKTPKSGITRRIYLGVKGLFR
jgi:hypothetical protein